MNKNNILKSISIIDVLPFIMIYIFNCCTAEIFKVSGVTITVLLGSFILWFFLVDLKTKSFLSEYLNAVLPLMGCFLIFLCFYLSRFDKTQLMLDIQNMIFLFIIAALIIYYSKYGSKRYKTAIIVFWMMDTLIATIYSIVLLNKYPQLSRTLASGNAGEISVEGVVSYGVIYALVLFVPILLKMSFESKNLFKGIFWFAVLSVFVVAMWYAQFTLSIILSVGGLLLFLMCRLDKSVSIRKRIIVFAALLFCGLLLTVWLENLLDFLLSLKGVPLSLHERFNDLHKFFFENTVKTNGATARIARYNMSFNAIFENYFIGYYSLGKGEIGGHSAFLDMLANYGIIYFGLFIFTFVRLFKIITSYFNKNNKKLYTVVTLVLIAHSCINTAFFSTILLVYIFIIPMLLMASQEEKLPENIVKEI